MAYQSVLNSSETKILDLSSIPKNPGPILLQLLFDRMVVLPEEWEEQPAHVREEIYAIDKPSDLIEKLVSLFLLTSYQAETIASGRVEDLVVGHYRLLEPLGQGGMGTVYRVEHVHLRRILALKVLADGFEGNRTLLNRFFLEARAVARLQHPNLVSCLDAGRHESKGLGRPVRCYYVMELIPGQDLGKLVIAKGPIPVNRAAGLFRQVAQALAEAHRHQLIHRDIKPGNILVTPDWQAKVLDFGLALHPHHQLTNPGEVLGTVGYMAPEQANHASAVDARADLFSMGAALFLALTGYEPFPDSGNAIRDLVPRLTAPPPRIRSLRPELPAELDVLVARLMDPNPDSRFPSAFSVGIALAPFVRWRPPEKTEITAPVVRKNRVLVADDDANIRTIIRMALKDEFECFECADGLEVMNVLEAERFDLLTIDLNMPRLDGASVIERVRSSTVNADTMILMCSGEAPAETLGGLLLSGADDFIQKPISLSELRSRVRGLLKRRADRMNVKATETKAAGRTPIPSRPIRTAETVRIGVNALTRTLPSNEADIDLEVAKSVFGTTSLASDLWQPGALVLASMCTNMLEEANIVTRGHGARLSQYVNSLAAATLNQGEYARLNDSTFLEMLATVAPLHDIGSLVIPGNIFQKPGPFSADERMVVQTHTTVGSEIIAEVAAKYAQSQPYLILAAEVVRSHHERWDGTGYPDSLAKQNIPLSARVIGLVTVYDALRSRRPFRPALNHTRAVKMISEECPHQFDPVLLAAFVAGAGQFERIFQQHVR